MVAINTGCVGCSAIRSVHTQHKFRLDGQQREYHAGDNVKVKNILGKEPLNPSEVGIPVHVRGHRASQFMKTDGLHHAQRVKEQRHELYACRIHILSKMLLHNREDFTSVTVKAAPEAIEHLKMTRSSVGSHRNMNERHWIQLNLNGDVSDREIYDLIRRSYEIVKDKYNPEKRHR